VTAHRHELTLSLERTLPIAEWGDRPGCFFVVICMALKVDSSSASAPSSCPGAVLSDATEACHLPPLAVDTLG
jgi:hypothetical protein